MVIDHIDHVYSRLDQNVVDEFCRKYYIPDHLLSEAPGPHATIRDAPEGKIRVYTRFFELGNFRVPLSPILAHRLRVLTESLIPAVGISGL